MYYTGLDVHKRTIQIQHMDDDGALGLSMNIATEASNIVSFLDSLDAPTAICFEASGSYWWISQLLQSHAKVSELKVVDPRRSRRLAEELSVQSGYGRAKTDRIDAEMLAELHRRDMAPCIHLPTSEQLKCRTLTRHRNSLVRESTRVGSRIQALLSMHGARIATTQLLKTSGQANVPFDQLPDYVKFSIDQLLDQLRLYQKQMSACANRLSECLAASSEQIKRLMSAPGIGIVTARIIASEIFSIDHFETPKHLNSYAGLAPIVSESGGKKGPCRLNRHCNYYLKYAFMIAAHAARTDSKYCKKYDQDVKKHGKTLAKFNIARRLIKSVYWMLTRQQSFQR